MQTVLCGLLFITIAAQAQDLPDSSVYKVKPWPDGAVFAAGAIGTYIGFAGQNDKGELTESFVNSLSRSDLSAFDRSAFKIDVDDRKGAANTSDVILLSSVAAPFLLLADDKVRREWLPVFSMYFESLAVNGGIQTNVAVLADRTRPNAYFTELSLGERVNNVNRSSFFSGHTSTSATACFFMARVIDDMHPELRGRRWLVYAAAAVPPTLTGWYRIQGSKHFPTDVIAGLVFGAAVGVLIPELHRVEKNTGISLVPYAAPHAMGISARWEW